MRLLSKAAQTSFTRRSGPDSSRGFWGWLNAVFNKVDHERIKAVGPDRAAAEWLLRCGARVRFQGFDRFHHDYNGLPTGPLGRYKIQAIDATESCIMHRGFDHLGRFNAQIATLRSHFVVQKRYDIGEVLWNDRDINQQSL